MSTLYLHIGTEKTGTTSVQNFFSRNRRLLAQQGVWYGRAFGPVSARKLAIYGRDPDMPDDGFRHFKIDTVVKHAEFCSEVSSDFKAEVREFRRAKAGIYFISSEHCHSRLIKSEMISRVRRLLSQEFDKVIIVCACRPQIELAVSLASTAARGGKVVKRDFFDIRPDMWYYNYKELLDGWGKEFGRENIIVAPFLKNRDMVRYFVSLFNIQEYELRAPVHRNEALDISAIAFCNAVYSYSKGNKSSILREVVERLPLYEPIKLPRDWAMEIQGRFNRSNQAVCREYDISHEDLVPDWGRYDISGNLDRLELPLYLQKNFVALVEAFLKRCY